MSIDTRSDRIAHNLFTLTITLVALFAIATVAQAQSSWTGINVGPGHAGANAGATGQWTHTDTESRVGKHGSMARGLAIGAGPNGLSLSHSIGGNVAGVGVGHNLNMTIGRGGAHVSHGAVKTIGGNSSVIAGGGSGQRFGRVSGGSQVTGFGNQTRAITGARTRQFFRRW
ncbi:MAG: hypothetical protein AAF664_12300 [Planctomycetota bacterium]